MKTFPTISFLSRVFNIAPHESGRVALAWSLKFFVYMGYTVGWTMLTAILVNRLGIEYLPILLVANAGLTILGTTIFSEIIHRFSRRLVMYGTLIAGTACLAMAIGILTSTGNLMLFFGFALVANAIFFTQLNILLGLFAEDLFSPLEGERAWPLINTSKYIGGIAGGLLILFSISVLHLEAPQLTYFWLGSLVLVVPVLVGFYTQNKKLPSLQISRPEKQKFSSLGKMREGLQHMRTIPFLVGMLVVVLLNGMFYTILSFQYTKAVDTKISQSKLVTEQQVSTKNSHASGEDTGQHEDLLTHDLGALYIGISLLALFVQMFFSSRIIERLGIVRTILIHPVTAFLATFGMLFKFGFGTAVTAKTLFKISGGIYTSAYYSSFYALKEDVREHAKELLEGLVMPLGIIAGTGLLFAADKLWTGTDLTMALSLTLLIVASVMGLTLLWLRERYTNVSKKNLEIIGDHPAKFTSIEVLAQHGHKNAAEILVKNLLYKKESEMMRIKLLETLSRIRDPKTIPEILTCFDDPSSRIKLAAVNALAEFKDLGAHFFTQSFTRYRVISALKELFESEDSKEIRSAIIHVFANMNQAEVVPFIIQTLETADSTVQADCVYVCGLFHDVSAAHYIEPFLRSEDPYLKANAIISLWQFPQYRLRLTILLTSLLESEDRTTEKAAIHMLGEIGAIQERPRLEKYLEHEDAELQLLAALALAKLNHSSVPPLLADFILHEDKALASLARKHLKRIPEEINKKVQHVVHQRLSKRLTELLKDSNAESLSELTPVTLGKLKELYSAAGEWNEVVKVEAVLVGRKVE